MQELVITINDQFRLKRKIAEGGCGLVYLGTVTQSNEQVAIKLEHNRHGPRKLKGEAEAYRALSGGLGIPKVRWSGNECGYYVLVLDLLGPSLEDLFNYCGRVFSLKTVLLLADQLITRIEYIHSKSLVHRDVKPENFLMGTGRQGNVVHAIDFGLAEDYRVNYRGHHEGTDRYASISYHNGSEQHRCDDLESLGYVLVYFLRGFLPWQDLKVVKGESSTEQIKEMKINMPVKELCADLPAEFETFITYSRSLGTDAKPDYSYLRGLFRDLFKRHGFCYDNVFDWTVLKYFETHGEIDAAVSDMLQEADHGQQSSAKSR